MHKNQYLPPPLDDYYVIKHNEISSKRKLNLNSVFSLTNFQDQTSSDFSNVKQESFNHDKIYKGIIHYEISRKRHIKLNDVLLNNSILLKVDEEQNIFNNLISEFLNENNISKSDVIPQYYIDTVDDLINNINFKSIINKLEPIEYSVFFLDKYINSFINDSNIEEIYSMLKKHKDSLLSFKIDLSLERISIVLFLCSKLIDNIYPRLQKLGN